MRPFFINDLHNRKEKKSQHFDDLSGEAGKGLKNNRCRFRHVDPRRRSGLPQCLNQKLDRRMHLARLYRVYGRTNDHLLKQHWEIQMLLILFKCTENFACHKAWNRSSDDSYFCMCPCEAASRSRSFIKSNYYPQSRESEWFRRPEGGSQQEGRGRKTRVVWRNDRWTIGHIQETSRIQWS